MSIGGVSSCRSTGSVHVDRRDQLMSIGRIVFEKASTSLLWKISKIRKMFSHIAPEIVAYQIKK